MEKKQVGEDHDPQEVLDAVNELVDLVEPVRKQLTVLAAIPEMLKRLDAREAELKHNANTLAQAAPSPENMELIAKKKKIIESEIEKTKSKKAALVAKQQKDSKALLTKALHDGMIRAVNDIKLGKSGRYKEVSNEEIEKQLNKNTSELSKKEEEELLAELDQLEG
eukprot:TRINITY_DN8481_c0_g2_i11.p1 TRINITY_DN8481_c0_g2~~TRINITY_DN8481_c0_g2_i11.p1  ORF type:complete len:166 (-),score=75.37 TRINITY_DN8481_c0_g2_i11:159-656(-)